MKVDWQYDVLFSFLVEHSRAGENDFQVIPTPACRTALSQAGLLFKAFPNGGLVAVEKRRQADGSSRVARGVRSLTRFTFLLVLKNPALLSETIPFNTADLPAFSGRRRVLFFDNVSASREIDTALERPSEEESELANLRIKSISAAEWVSKDDLASIVPERFELLMEPGVSQLRVESLAPGTAAAQIFSVTPQNRQLTLPLAAGCFRATRSGGTGAAEKWVADDALLRENALGIIDIYKDGRINYEQTIRYDILF